MSSNTPASDLVAILVGVAIGLTGLFALFHVSATEFEDAALDGQTVSIFSKVDGRQIHCRDGRDLEACINGSKARSAANVVIWLGNSQVHAVNQPREGDTNAPPLLFQRLRPLGLDLLTFSQPNASLQEHYVLFEHLRRRVPVKKLVLAVVFDDLRESGLRADIAQLLGDAELTKTLADTAIGSTILKSAEEAKAADSELAGVAGTVQEHSERYLTGWLTDHWALWRLRPEARGQIFLSLYKLRNAAFGITPTTKRKMIAAPYRANLAALEAILDSCSRQEIHALLYVAPLRPGAEPPYVLGEYLKFKSELKDLVGRYRTRFANLEHLVPEELWGEKASTTLENEGEVDFMHFQARGHRLLAERLFLLLTTPKSDG